MNLFRLSKIFFFFSFVSIFVFCSASYGQSSRNGVLEITGWLLNDDDEPIRRADVAVYHGHERVVEDRTNRRGRFRFDLAVDRNYVAVFSAEGYVTKRISFNTGLPNDFSGFNAFYFEFLVELFPSVRGVDYTLLETPYIEITYMPEMQEFFFDEYKAKPVLAQVEQIKHNTYEMIDLIEDYNDIIAEADKYFANNDEANAIKLYNEALSIFPDEEHPKNRLREMFAYEEPGEDEILASEDGLKKLEDTDYTFKDEIDDNIIAGLAGDKDFYNTDDIKSADKETLSETNDRLAIAEESRAEMSENLYEEIAYIEPTKDIVSEVPSFDGDNFQTYFGFASYLLNDEAEEVLDYAISQLKSNPDLNIILYGHTDIRGNPLFNFYLSQLRAHTAYRYCIDRGIDPGRIITLSYGQNNLAVKNARKESEHRKNRRVEINLVDHDGFTQIASNIRTESYMKLNNLKAESNFSEDVEFMVQFIASYIPVGTSFFHRILSEYKDTDIIYYYDNDKLHRYLIGSYSTVEEATNAAFKLHGLGYQAYVVAFENGERISVSRALMLQGNAN